MSQTTSRAVALAILRRQNLTNLEYARTIELPDGDFAGQNYDPGRHKAQEAIIHAIDAGASWVAILKPVQDGGSLASFAPILRRSSLLGQTSIIAYPTMDAGKDAWSKKVWPMLERQGGQMPTSGGGSRGGAARVVNLPSGGSIILRAAGGRGESGQASITADALLVDEVDDWADMRVLRLIERRLSRSRDPLIIYVSTCKRDAADGVEQSRIVRLYEQGCRARLEYPCPHCGAMFHMEWSQVDVETRTIKCPHCEAALTDKERVAMLPHAHLVKGDPLQKKFSIMWTALESPFPMLVDGQRMPVLDALCIEFRAAEDSTAMGDHGLMRQFMRDRMCAPYRGDIIDESGQTIIPTRSRLAAMSQASDLLIDASHEDEQGRHDLAHIPSWVENITVACDVQAGGDRAPSRVLGIAYGRGGARGAILGYWTYLAGPSGRQATVAELHGCLDRIDGMLRDWNPSAPIVARGIDTGDQTDELLRWIAGHKQWSALKGTTALKAGAGDLAGWMYRRPQAGGYILRLVESESVLRVVHGELLAKPGDGSCQLPHGLEPSRALLSHICASVEYEPGKWSKSAKDRKHHPEWQRRNDYADALVYARALAYEWQCRVVRRPRRYGVVGKVV